MGWTDERVELLKKLWADGLSASQIATELGGITRNSVIGKVHRLGLSGRARTSEPATTALRPSKAQIEEQVVCLAQPASIGNVALATALCYEVEIEPKVELVAAIVP